MVLGRSTYSCAIDPDEREITHGHREYFGMFTDEGNRATAAMVDALRAELHQGRVRTAEDFNATLQERVEAIADAGHDEVLDTDVRERVLEALAEPLQAAGIDPEHVDFP